MSSYVQTFSKRDQAILNHPFFDYSSCKLTRVEEEQPVNALWSNSGCIRYVPPDPGKQQPCIRRGDIIAFREIWLQPRPPSPNIPGPLHGCFTPVKWTHAGSGYMSTPILAYRTFGLSVYSETPDDALEFSAIDVDQALKSCLESFQEDEMPICTGEWSRDAEKVTWRVHPISKPYLKGMISNTRDKIRQVSQREFARQCDIMIALRRSYKPVVTDRDPWSVLSDNVDSNARLGLDGVAARLGVNESMFDTLPDNGALAVEYAQYSIPELEAMFVASRELSKALNCHMITDSLPGGDDAWRALLGV